MVDAIGLEQALRKVRRHLLPFLFVLYLVACLDRVNISFAAPALSTDLGLDPASYGFAAGIFFAGYILCEVPSNLILHRVGARQWISRILLSWGVVAVLMATVTHASQFDGLRFLLGAAEAGFFPGIVLYLSQWIPKSDRARALAGFMIAIPMAGLLGGPLSAALLSLDGFWGMAGWRWLFLMEGLPALLLAFAVWFWLPNRPRHAPWLTASEAEALEQALRAERDHLQHQGAQVLELGGAIRQQRLWLLIAMYLGIYYGITGFGFWIPRFVAQALPAAASSPALANTLSAIPYGLAVIAMVLVGRSADHHQQPLRHVVAPLAIGVIALVLAIGSGGVMRLGWISLATAAVFSCKGPFWAIPPQFLDEQAAAVGFAGISTFGSVGGLLSPNVMGALMLQNHGEALALASLAVVLLGSVGLALWLQHHMRTGAEQLGPGLQSFNR